MSEARPPEQPVNQFGTPVNQFGTPQTPPPAGPGAPWPSGSFSLTPSDPYAPTILGLEPSRPNPARIKAVMAGGLAVVLLTVVGIGWARVAGSSGRPSRPGVPAASSASSATPDAPGGADDPGDGSAQTAPGVIPPALSAVQPASSPSVVTPASAQQVLAALWPVRERILATRDIADLAGVESGSALAGDRIRLTCGCIHPIALDSGATSQVFVAQQPHYPAQFLAEVQNDDLDRPFMEFAAFTRASAHDDWRLAFDSGLVHEGAHYLDTPTVDPLGYDAPISAGVRSRARSMPGRLAAYYQRAKDSGRSGPSSGFAPGPWTTTWVAKSASNPNGRVLSDGTVVHTRYTSTAGQPIYLAPTNDWTIACGVVSYHSVRRRPGGVMVQDEARTVYRRSLPPGRYSELIEDGQVQTCFYLPTYGPGPVTVAGGELDAETFTRGVPVGPTV